MPLLFIAKRLNTAVAQDAEIYSHLKTRLVQRALLLYRVVNRHLGHDSIKSQLYLETRPSRCKGGAWVSSCDIFLDTNDGASWTKYRLIACNPRRSQASRAQLFLPFWSKSSAQSSRSSTVILVSSGLSDNAIISTKSSPVHFSFHVTVRVGLRDVLSSSVQFQLSSAV